MKYKVSSGLLSPYTLTLEKQVTAGHLLRVDHKVSTFICINANKLSEKAQNKQIKR